MEWRFKTKCILLLWFSDRLGMEVNIGPLRFSMTTLWTSTASIVITTIPLFIFVYFFRSYRPMRGPRVTANSLSMSETFSPTQRWVRPGRGGHAWTGTKREHSGHCLLQTSPEWRECECMPRLSAVCLVVLCLLREMRGALHAKCANSGMVVSVWNLWRAHRCWYMRLCTGAVHRKRVCTRSLLWAKNPLPHLGLESFMQLAVEFAYLWKNNRRYAWKHCF